MKPLVHTGDSANIAWYSEPGKADGYVWAEVLRSDWTRKRGQLTVYNRPRFYITIYRYKTGEVAKRTYIPRHDVAPGRLPDELVTRLVRQALKERSRP